jgi:phosphohistidine swiveling domain-containing protein
MTREEEIAQIAKEYYNPKTVSIFSLQMRFGFITGAQWADETMVEKMYNWIDSNIDKYTIVDGDKIVLTKSFKKDFMKNMKREKQIIETAKEYYNPKSDTPYALQMNIGFVEGAKWADKTMIEKMYKWLESNIDKHTMIDGDKIVLTKSFKEDFIKAMEE